MVSIGGIKERQRSRMKAATKRRHEDLNAQPPPSSAVDQLLACLTLGQRRADDGPTNRHVPLWVGTVRNRHAFNFLIYTSFNHRRKFFITKAGIQIMIIFPIPAYMLHIISGKYNKHFGRQPNLHSCHIHSNNK